MSTTIPPPHIEANPAEPKQQVRLDCFMPEENDTEAWRVGWLFVQQYYTILNKDPQKLHQFYNNTSQCTFGNEGEQIKAKRGRAEIEQHIQDFGFNNCKVKLSNIDSQISSGGVLLHVLGEMSNAGGPAHKFSQTFFLANQPKGYFVMNDIFRFLKEEVEAEYEDGNGTYEGRTSTEEVGNHADAGHHQHYQSQYSHPHQPLVHQLPPPVPIQHHSQQINHYTDYSATTSRVSPLPARVSQQRSPSPSGALPPRHDNMDVAMLNNMNAMGGMNRMMQTWSQPPPEPVEPVNWDLFGKANMKNDINNNSSSQNNSSVSEKTPSPQQPLPSPGPPTPAAPMTGVNQLPSSPPQQSVPLPTPANDTSLTSIIATQPTAHIATPARSQSPASTVVSPVASPAQKGATTLGYAQPQASSATQTSGPAVSSAVANPPQKQHPASQRSKVEANKKSWATIASSTDPGTTTSASSIGHSINGTQPTSPVPASSQRRSPSRPQSTNENEPQRRSSVGGQENGNAFAHVGKKFDHKTVDEKNSVYVKNIIHAVTRDMVRDAFSKFGAIRHIDVVPTKGIAFVEFTTSEPVNKAVAQNTLVISLPDGTRHTLLADRRKIFNSQGRNNGPRYANQEDSHRLSSQQQQQRGGTPNHSNVPHKQQNRGTPKQHNKGTKE